MTFFSLKYRELQDRRNGYIIAPLSKYKQDYSQFGSRYRYLNNITKEQRLL